MLNKNILFVLFFALLVACDEDGTRLQLKENISANQISELSSADYVLQAENADQVFETFNWTKVDFGYPASVTYLLQLDRAGNNFASPVEVATTDTITASVTVAEMNDILLDLGLPANDKSEVEMRVRSSIADNVEPVYSDVKRFSVTPYPTEAPPVYMIGAATGGWDLAKAVQVNSIGQNKYETIAQFTNGGNFRFFATPSWDAEQYNWSTFQGGTLNANLQNAGDNDGNFLFTGPTGWYKITADINNKTIALEPAEEPTDPG
jgi:hypothetical protein